MLPGTLVDWILSPAPAKTWIKDRWAWAREEFYPLSQTSFPSLRPSSGRVQTESGKARGCLPPSEPPTPRQGEWEALGLFWLE